MDADASAIGNESDKGTLGQESPLMLQGTLGPSIGDDYCEDVLEGTYTACTASTAITVTSV